MGAQSYHGKDELIASNQIDVIDAVTIASKASVSHWFEKGEEKVLDALYWRQTFNFQTQTLSVSVLLTSTSELTTNNAQPTGTLEALHMSATLQSR